VTILQSPTPTDPVDEAHDIREQVHAHARAQLYNNINTDTMPHGVSRTWIRIAHHVVACLYTWTRSAGRTSLQSSSQLCAPSTSHSKSLSRPFLSNFTNTSSSCR
jgi:hypothetical protein